MEDKKSEFELKRHRGKENLSNSSLVLNILFTLIVNFSFIIAIAIVLGIDDGSCDKPIRQWLIVRAVANVFLIVIYSISQIKKISEKIRKFMFSYIFMPGAFLNFAWMIVGSVWEFESDDCYDKFYNGWALTLAILIVDYVSIGLVCCLVSCCICAPGMIFKIFKMIKLNYDELKEMEKDSENCVKEQKKAELEAQSNAKV
ncbi:unnamed protein product [Blepharisma stoltei]|uniref:Opsin n=1 Tax=Blepharisma stoltei TaxID=1481888 RepID=A0AAU9K008_9CILI|nr:unnamed protein product [Blepharisma stoltei]